MDFTPPDNLPKAKSPDPVILAKCVSKTSKYFKIHPLILYTLIKVEGGKIGTLSKNNNGTFDMGIMQINTIHLRSIAKTFPGKTWHDVTYGTCVNVAVGGWILNRELKNAKDFWTGVGNYHSKTKKFHDIYLSKVMKTYSKLKKDYLSALKTIKLKRKIKKRV